MFYTVPRWNLVHIHLNMFRWYKNKSPRLNSDRMYCCNLFRKFQHRILIIYDKNNWKKEVFFAYLLFLHRRQIMIIFTFTYSFQKYSLWMFFSLLFGFIVIGVFVKYYRLFSICKTTPNTHRLRQNAHECIRNPKLTLFKQSNHCIKLENRFIR